MNGVFFLHGFNEALIDENVENLVIDATQTWIRQTWSPGIWQCPNTMNLSKNGDSHFWDDFRTLKSCLSLGSPFFLVKLQETRALW